METQVASNQEHLVLADDDTGAKMMNIKEQERPTEHKKELPGHLSRVRWFMLLILWLNISMCMQGTLSLISINNVANKYFQTSSTPLEWLSSMPLISHVLLTLPAGYAIDRYGTRHVLVFSSFCNVIGTVFNYGGLSSNKVSLLCVGQSFTSLAYSSLLHIPRKVAASWFPSQERLMATTLASLSIPASIAVIFIHPILVKKSGILTEDKVEMVLLAGSIEAFLILGMTFFYREQPLIPPHGSTDAVEEATFKDNFSKVAKNKKCIVLSITYLAIIGSGIALYFLLNEYMVPHIPIHSLSTGIISFTVTLAMLMVLNLVLWIWGEYYRFSSTVIFFIDSSFILWTLFTMLVIRLETVEAIFGVNLILGAVIQSFTTACMDQPNVMTKSISEEKSNMVVIFSTNGFICAGIVLLSALAKAGLAETVWYMMFGLVFIASVCLMSFKEDRKELNAYEMNLKPNTIQTMLS